MDISLEQYILNPMGKNNAVLNASTRELMRKRYVSKFDNILLRENGSIKYDLYYDSKSNTYWAHIKVPSETVKKFYYDVVLKFYANESISLGGEDLFKYNVKFYSNDPAFVYTYAHVFLKNKLFINELAPLMSREALKKEAKEKNPNNNVGYVKTIYFAYLTMKNRKLNKASKFRAEAKKFSLEYLLSTIEPADKKIKERQSEGEKVSKRKKIEVDDNTLRNISRYSSDNSRLQVRTTKKVSNISKRTSDNIKSVKFTSKIKKK